MKRVAFCVVVAISLGQLAFGHSGPYTFNSDTNELVQIDPNYQFMTSVAALPYEVITIEYSTDGFIYGVSRSLDTLVKIAPGTGTVETVGPLGFDLDWHADLDEDEQGQLWMLESFVGRLYTIDRSTGTATLRCQTDFPYVSGLAIADGRWWTSRLDSPIPPTDPGCGLEYLWDGPSFLVQLESADDGWIYDQSVWSAGQYNHYTFARTDPATGSTQSLGEFVYWNWGGLSGITFDPNDQPAPAIPAVGWPGAAVLALLLTAAGTWVLLRRS